MANILGHLNKFMKADVDSTDSTQQFIEVQTVTSIADARLQNIKQIELGTVIF